MSCGDLILVPAILGIPQCRSLKFPTWLSVQRVVAEVSGCRAWWPPPGAGRLWRPLLSSAGRARRGRYGGRRWRSRGSPARRGGAARIRGIDRRCARGGPGGRHGDRAGLVVVAAPVGGLAAGAGEVALPPGGGEGMPADRAGDRLGVVPWRGSGHGVPSPVRSLLARARCARIR